MEKNTIELDGKKFDGRFRYYCMKKIRDFRFKMLAQEYRTPENKARLKHLYYELAHSPLVNVDGGVYGRACGNPSGQACTTPDNLFKNFMDIVVLWHLIMPVEYHTYTHFSQLLILCVVGDDINISVHPTIQHLFNAKAIQDKMTVIDMEYHFASMEFRHNYECTFLGHAFEFCEIPKLGYGMYLPVIDCNRMRSNMLIYNEDHTIQNSIIRACGLRNETFACLSCRGWFLGLIEYLRKLTADDTTLETLNAWKNYNTDMDLWKIYSGKQLMDVHGYPGSSLAPSPILSH